MGYGERMWIVIEFIKKKKKKTPASRPEGQMSVLRQIFEIYAGTCLRFANILTVNFIFSIMISGGLYALYRGQPISTDCK